MTIIKHGNKWHTFVCENCGCEWGALEKEFEETKTLNIGTRLVCKCPECGDYTWKKKESNAE